MRLNIEYKIMTNLAPDYEKLPPLHKLEVFECALSQTDGQVSSFFFSSSTFAPQVRSVRIFINGFCNFGAITYCATR